MIIGLGYKKRSGKDTFAGLLLDALQRESCVRAARITGFGDSVKDISYQLYKHKGLKTGAYYEDHPEEKEKPLKPWDKSPRDIWQYFGTEAVRNFYAPTWLEKTLNQCNQEKGYYTIVKDVRFLNEAHGVLDAGGILIRIDRNLRESDPHASENELDGYEGWTLGIDNNKGLIDLAKSAQSLCFKILYEDGPWNTSTAT